ncbi:MAG: hypothetical protein ABJF10_08200 [Chthoniobacter sp.]|uniref:hypothetical protein n=1 Tax=Chthoniobacter sp. TaxID=2510640 RepID=UPI0032AC15C5
MKPTPDVSYCLTPQAEGWAVWRDAQRLHIASTLAEALGLLPVASRFEFAVPCHPLIMERLRLPATERDELAGMVQLQWEKALPYSPEEITGDFAVLETANGETVVWSAAAAHDAWREFGDTWSGANRWPRRVAPYVCYVAAACPAEETILVVYVEQGHWVVAVVEDRRPGWVHVMSAADAAGFAAEFPSLTLTMGLDGVPNSYARVLLSPEVIGCEAALQSAVQAPVEMLPLVTPVTEVDVNLLPSLWQVSSQQHRDGRAWRKRVLLAAAVYLFFVAAAAVDLFVLQHKASGLEAELNAQRPALGLLQSRRARFNSLGAAIDSHRYAIELLYLLNRCLPGESVRFTEFEQMPQQWRVVGEAPTASLAIEYLSRLKRDPDLSGNDITADPPRLLANERAQFQVIGKP